MHPEIQRKAQAEIDRVVGSDRFPTFADQPDLPYVDAVVKEVHRWNPVAPLGEYTSDVVIWHPLFRGLIAKGPTRNTAHRVRGRHLRGIFRP